MSKLSSYNHFFPWRNSTYLAYNARSGAVGLMTRENYDAFQALAGKLAESPSVPLSADEQTLLTQLEHGLFVHPDELSELDWLKFVHHKARFDSESLGFVLAPTMACNMACEYCFEDNKHGRMSPEVIESVVQFIARRADQLRVVEFTWYGGEPLLAMDIIEDLTKRILKLAEEHRFLFGASTITNGYLLTKDNVDRLVDLKVNAAQITLDGPARIHDTKRPLKNGRRSFSTIIENIKYAVTRMSIVIRVNVDKSFTRDIISELLDELEQAGLREKVGMNFGLLEPATSACANISESCFDMDDFSRAEIEFFTVLLDRGFRIDKLPSPVHVFCVAQSVNGFVVDPDGDFYRCFNYIGDKSHVSGNIAAELDYSHPEFTRLFKFDPFEEDSCRKCNILPICMGGCPSRRDDRGLTAEELCASWSYNLAPMLDIIARSLPQAEPHAAQQPKETT